MKKDLVLYPFLFAIYPILFLFSHNISQANPVEILIPLLISLSFTFLGLYLLNFILKSKEKSGLIVSIFLLIFFFGGQLFYSLIDGFSVAGTLIKRPVFIYSILFIFLVISFFIIKIRKNLENTTIFLNITSFSLIIMCILNIGIYIYSNITYKFKPIEIQTISHQSKKQTEKLPDIYYIILDGRASSATLKEIYNYDDQKFINQLKNTGFFIATHSRTNYPVTMMSLSSSLNMSHINNLIDSIPSNSSKRAYLYKILKNNEVFRFLKSKGYKIINFGSGHSATNYNKNADLNIQCGAINEFSSVLIQKSLLSLINITKNAHKNRVLGTFSKLEKIAETKGPKLVFAHIICPHPPYIFDQDGNPVKESALQEMSIFVNNPSWELKEKYLNQVMFVNKKITNVVNSILEKSEKPPIIILQADHGPDLIYGDRNSKQRHNALNERMRIFNAYYLPYGGNKILYNDITPVNSFRLIFNYYFDTDYKLLDDKSYIPNKSFYNLKDATDEIK